jgi:hypothetical protein
MMNGSRLNSTASQLLPESSDQHCVHPLRITSRKYQQLRCIKKAVYHWRARSHRLPGTRKSLLAIIALLNLLQPSPIRQHLVSLALLQPNLRPTPPLPLLPPPNTMILQPPIHNLPTHPVRRPHTTLLPLKVNPTLGPTRNPTPAHKIPLVFHDPRLVCLSPHNAADDQRAAYERHHSEHEMQQPVIFAPREERPVLPFPINMAGSGLGFRCISHGSCCFIPTGSPNPRIPENRPRSRPE